MADEPPVPSYISEWRNALADDMAQRAGKPVLLNDSWWPTMDSNLGDFARSAPLALGGFRAPVPTSTAANALGMKPIPRKADMGAGDNGAQQHVYEAMLGRTRNSATPNQPAEPGSGWWNVGGQPIPKPTNVLPWLGAGGVGYGIWNLGGGSDLMEQQKESGADWGGLARDILTGRIVQKFRDARAAENARVPYPPDPNKP